MAYIGKVTAGGTTYHVGSTLYGTCDTAAATVAKVAIVNGFDTLETGVTVHIKFTNANTATGPTLAIKPSSSGTAVTAKSIKKNGTTAPGTTAATSWMDGSVVSFTYDGTYWQMNDHIDNTDTYVTQTNTTTNADYRVLLSANANDTTQTTTARKSTNFKANPSTGNLTIGGQLTDKWGLQSFRSLTTAQYNALSSTEKNNGTYYHLTDSYSDVSFDSNVSQTPTTADHDYRVLLSGSDNDTASVEGALKNTDLIYNPYKHELRLYEDVSATAANYVQIYPNLINIHSNIDQMRVESNDIWYNNSWDGTNNSLKSTISSLNNNLVKYKDLTFTITGASSAYYGYYYYDISINNLALPSGSALLSVYIINVPNNLPCITQIANNAYVRINSSTSDINNKAVKIRVAYI